MRFIGYKDNYQHLLVTKEDIENILEEVIETRKINQEDARYINKVMELQKAKIKEIMTHRSSIVALEKNSSIYELKKLIKLTALSKIVIYEENLDNILGVVYANDLLKAPSSISEIMKPIKYIPSQKSIYSSFNDIKEEKLSVAIVIDEFGGCIGIVTMHDIFEFIVGEVKDYHSREREFRGITFRGNTNILIVKTETNIDNLNKFLQDLTGEEKYNIEEDKYETINGFLINYLQRIPIRGEKFTYKKLKYKVIKAQRNKIDSITISLNGVKRKIM